MARIEITENEIMEALRVAKEAPEGAWTLTDLTDRLQLSRRKINNALRELNKQQRLVVVHVHRQGIDGRNIAVPAYALKDQ